MNYWGKHLLVNASNGNRDYITDPARIKTFVDDLVNKIDMEAFGETIIENFALDDPEKAGYSFVQLISTSHLAAHFCTNTGDIYFCAFSCKEFDEIVVLKLLEEYFEPKDFNYKTIYRDANN